MMTESDAIEIHAGNATDRTIKIEKLSFTAEASILITVAPARPMLDIPPHDKRIAVINASKLAQELGSHKRGRFILVDALDYEHKTKRITV